MGFTPNLIVIMDGTPFGEIGQQHAPLASAFQQIQEATKYLVKVYFAGGSSFTGLFQQGTYLLKLLTGDITRVSFSHPQIIKVQCVLVKTMNRYLNESRVDYLRNAMLAHRKTSTMVIFLAILFWRQTIAAFE